MEGSVRQDVRATGSIEIFFDTKPPRFLFPYYCFIALDVEERHGDVLGPKRFIVFHYFDEYKPAFKVVWEADCGNMSVNVVASLYLEIMSSIRDLLKDARRARKEGRRARITVQSNDKELYKKLSRELRSDFGAEFEIMTREVAMNG